MPTALGPVSTGNAKADAAIVSLQPWEHSPHTPVPMPTGNDYVAATSAADFEDVNFQACEVTLHESLSLPSPTNAVLTKALKGRALAAYEEKVFVAQTPLPKVFGFRDHGYDAEVPASAQLLLQLSGESQSGMEFGDAEPLSFFVDRQRLAKGDVSKAWPKLGD
ncbi:MAG: hypothetical protein SFW67_21065 [Myxococcaceae bacterium]|nr:hypothetical protein [Myxococcaceae bacterium]